MDTLVPPQVPEPTEARAKRAREKTCPILPDRLVPGACSSQAEIPFLHCGVAQQTKTDDPPTHLFIDSQCTYVSRSLRHRNCGKTRRTNRSNLRRDAERTEPPIKPLAQKTLGIKKHVDMATATSSSDLTCGQGLRICTPRACAFESPVVLGV